MVEIMSERERAALILTRRQSVADAEEKLRRAKELLREAEDLPMQACEGFEWCGQSLKYCDRCGAPFWDHTHERRSVGLVLIEPALAASVKERWNW